LLFTDRKSSEERLAVHLAERALFRAFGHRLVRGQHLFRRLEGGGLASELSVRDLDRRYAELASVEGSEILDLALKLVALLGELGNDGFGLGLVSGQRGNDGVTLSERGLVGLAQLGKLGNLLLGFSLEGGDFEIKTEIAPAVDAAALAAKDSEIATFKAEAEKQVAELSKLGETHKAALAERDAIIATLTADKTKAEAVVAELSKERDELKSKVEDLAAFDARQLGVAPVKVAHAQLARKSAAFKTPEEMLTAYEAMPEGAEKRSFRKMNREALFAAFSVRK